MKRSTSRCRKSRSIDLTISALCLVAVVAACQGHQNGARPAEGKDAQEAPPALVTKQPPAAPPETREERGALTGDWRQADFPLKLISSGGRAGQRFSLAE